MPVSTLLAPILASAFTSAGSVQDRAMVVRAFDEIAFVPIIKSRPDGPQIGVLRGNPDEGPSDMILKMPRGPGTLHTHTADYHLMIITGEMKHWDASTAEADVRALGPGSYWFQPSGQPHADSCLSDECVMFIHWSGKRDGQLYKPN